MKDGLHLPWQRLLSPHMAQRISKFLGWIQEIQLTLPFSLNTWFEYNRWFSFLCYKVIWYFGIWPNSKTLYFSRKRKLIAIISHYQNHVKAEVTISWTCKISQWLQPRPWRVLQEDYVIIKMNLLVMDNEQNIILISKSLCSKVFALWAFFSEILKLKLYKCVIFMLL